jgi:hypothetical protein
MKLPEAVIPFLFPADNYFTHWASIVLHFKISEESCNKKIIEEQLH